MFIMETFYQFLTWNLEIESDYQSRIQPHEFLSHGTVDVHRYNDKQLRRTLVDHFLQKDM